MNFKPMIIEKLHSFSKQNPDYTMSQMIYSILAHQKININTKSDLLKVSDEDFIAGVERALDSEKENN